jgi:hypothetical protein
MPRRLQCLATLAALACLTHAVPAAAQTSPVVVEKVTVEPTRDLAADVLCRLAVTLRNTSEQIASQLGFKVTINGQELPVYVNQLFMYPVEPGASTEIPLYNFWSTETSRPRPADGKLAVEVTLAEAQWMDISTDAEGVEVWKPLGAIDGLPSSAGVTLEMP